YGYLARIGLVTEAEARDPPVEGAWARQGAWMQHLWATAAENRVAVDEEGRVIGWAMSIEREGHLELVMFFVEPGVQSRGLGRALIARALPPGRGPGRSIMATQDERALSLYLRSGVSYVTSSVEVVLKGAARPGASGLSFRRLDAGAEAVAEVAAIEREVLGFARPPETAFLLARRPAWIADDRDGRAAGFAFGVEPNPEGADAFPPPAGPMASLDPADMPALLDHVMAEAAPGEDFVVTLPMANRTAMAHALARGGRIDPFYLKVLAGGMDMRLDRFVHTSPCFVL
ncbi:MAG: GNAT family N-acetyltransferase, partial [Rhodospirillaceae bacterium]